MRARLGFSLAAHLDPDILVIDEVLSVGDQAFQDRAYERIQKLVTSGLPVVLVSHQVSRIQELATEVLVLERGRVVERGDPATCVEAYLRRQSGRIAERVATRIGDVGRSSVTIRSVTPADGDTVPSGAVFRVRFEGIHDGGALPDDIDPLAIVLVKSTGGTVAVLKSADFGVEIVPNSEFEIELALQMNLPPGTYLLQSVAVSSRERKVVQSGPALFVRVTEGAPMYGMVQLNPEMRLLSSVGSK
jgi:hypothetical protein